MALHAMQSSATSISGSVSGADGTLPEMIVYLEQVDPNVRPAPETTAAEISQKGAQFSPPLLIISVGQRVDFKNDEDRPIEHNVFSRSPAKPFDLGLYKPPAAKSVTFDTPGVVRLFCSIHRAMDGMIYVCPTKYWSRVGPDGRFQIDNVPAGVWRLKTWQRNARYSEQDVPLTATGAAIQLDLQMKRD
jgi:plastocyanin